MKPNTTKIAFAVALAICMLLSTCGMIFAADVTTPKRAIDDDRMIVYTSTSFVRDSSTKGTVSVIADSSNPKTPYMISKITLQEAPLGTTKFVNSDVDPKTKTVTRSTIAHVVSFTISTKKEYRAKIEITDNTNGNDSTIVFYEYLQD